MKTLATFWKTEEAHLLRLRLQQAQIEAFIQDENITQLHPWRAAAIGGVRVQVSQQDFNEAQKILASWKSTLMPGTQAAEDSSGAFECYACSTPIPANESSCPSCGWSYKDGAEEVGPEGGPDHLKFPEAQS